MIEITIDNRLRFRRDQLPDEVQEKLRKQFTHKNPAHAKQIAMGRKYTKEPESYSMWDQNARELSLPRGGMQRVRDILDEHDLDYEVADNRSMGSPSTTGSFVDPWELGMDLFPPHKLVAWQHQDEMVAAAKKYGQILIRAPTGSGKTSAILKLIAELQVPALVIMWDTGLLKQWQERIEIELGVPRAEQGIIQGPKCRLRPITLAMQQTLNRWTPAKWEKIRGVFALVACDEVQRYAATTFTHIIDWFDSYYRVGVSADERRKDRKTFIIYDQFGAVRHEVKKATLIEKRIIHEVEVYVVPTTFTAQWYVDQKEEAKAAAAAGNPKQDPRAFNRLLDEMEQDADRNALAVHLIQECVRAGLPTLSFTHWVDHARKLDVALTKQGIASGLALGGKDWEETFDETIARLRDGSLQVGCGTFGKLGVGHDIPTVAAGVAVTPVHNNRAFLGQVKGRICRTTQGKENARILVLWDRLIFGAVPLYNLKRWNDVCRVWCEWDRRWKEIGQYIKENRYGGTTGQSTSAAEVEGIFKSAQRG